MVPGRAHCNSLTVNREAVDQQSISLCEKVEQKVKLLFLTISTIEIVIIIYIYVLQRVDITVNIG